MNLFKNLQEPNVIDEFREWLIDINRRLEPFLDKYPGQVPGQVFTQNGLKEVKYEKNRSISILYPIDYQ